MSACVEHPGYCQEYGYGVLVRNKKRWLAHRWAWTQAHGPIPDGMFVLHHCDNPPCINVEHLYLGTKAENTADMMRRRRNRNQNTAATHCKRGHPFDETNTYLRPNDGKRACKACQRQRERDYQQRRRGGGAS